MAASSTQAAASTSSTAAGTDEKAFAADPRIHWDTQTNKWIFETEDQELEWDATRQAWQPVVTVDAVAEQTWQSAYSVEGVDESVPAGPVLEREAKKNKKKRKKHKKASAYHSESSGSDGDEETNGKRRKDDKPRASRNTAVYVTHLPPDATVEEMKGVFSKAGLILEDQDGEPKIRIYKNEDGTPKGEALVVYLNEASVMLAETLLDDTELRLGSNEGRMRVAKADFSKSANSNNANDQSEGSKKSEQDKAKQKKRAERLRSKLTDWSSDDDTLTAQTKAPTAKATRFARIVVLYHMFTLTELEEDPTLLLELKEEVLEECEETIGKVNAITLYDKEADGVITIKFADAIAAQACVLKMNGRFFAGRQIEASIFDGKKRFRKTGDRATDSDLAKEATAVAGTEEEERERLDKFAEWLEQEGS
ncbi:uncharacterized protein L969DRAFT_51782 [Mixia osmundae IAM 14324]|uniref:RRM domain-containing protein n=1 Tax=Mixia osmundae (strain CBS 9802 / IAM 14324 / JCM 22182 / KY 12970) TaxID=764103 RepID=G7DSN3_MIXOS|nr:uncharacterized protein L969DRAFT_51782 [Mixia osmundae IAM 14324]KEI37911.1 hypothetical protein L969DRAFT_51782 [Mixia osmundae IAM 14324]GAA93593.1 hypothetical protein E5Q_00237 [Mixia osmundae IAM 14324]